MVAQVVRVEAVSCDSMHEAAWLERNLLETSLPPWNRTPGGQENVVFIRMDMRPPAPGLTVEHVIEPARNVEHFGPYLGGQRARHAIAALHRILPLAYTGTRLRGAQLEMARARGVAGADRAQFIGALNAVLQREPDAVAWARAELKRRRDRAMGTLAFELAGRIHDEIEAFDWVTSPQRVTNNDGGDCDVFGWSAAVLLHLGVRDGRVSQWSQRSCSKARAEPLLATTPASWTDFAQRNAELAAALADRSA
jgi:excinuclease ABC subunit C